MPSTQLQLNLETVEKCKALFLIHNLSFFFFFLELVRVYIANQKWEICVFHAQLQNAPIFKKHCKFHCSEVIFGAPSFTSWTAHARECQAVLWPNDVTEKEALHREWIWFWSAFIYAFTHRLIQEVFPELLSLSLAQGLELMCRWNCTHRAQITRFLSHFIP